MHSLISPIFSLSTVVYSLVLLQLVVSEPVADPRIGGGRGRGRLTNEGVADIRQKLRNLNIKFNYTKGVEDNNFIKPSDNKTTSERKDREIIKFNFYIFSTAL